MEFTKLTDQERADWLELTETDYENSPLKDDMSSELFDLIAGIFSDAAEDDFDGMLYWINSQPSLHHRGLRNPVFRRLQIRAYEHAIACGNGPCCCNLGNLYHDADTTGTAEDYDAARELYELGADRGDDQSAINLGYLYYYGRGVARDYQRAYECFAHGALSADNPEGYWKLGDLYASGNGVRQSDRMAWTLYSKAYKNAHGSALTCRAAHHMADYLLTGIEGVVEEDPTGALRLYNEAEAGYYTLIDAGMTYYIPQLQQAIEGQEKARWVIQHRFLHFD